MIISGGYCSCHSVDKLYHCKKGIVMLTRGLLSELQREFKNENTAVMCL